MINNYTTLNSSDTTRFKKTGQKNLFFMLLFMLFSVISANAQVDVASSGGTPLFSYTTLKGAFDAINAGTHTGTITISISGNTTETAPAVLNASGSGSSSYTSILVSPTGGAARTISGAIAAGSPLIDLNGADNVTFNGLNTGGDSLTLSNTTASNSTGTSTIRFIGGATSNTITNCSVLGSFSAAVTTNGGNIFFSTDALTANGNDNNTVSFCDIGPAGTNLNTKGIYMNGSTTTSAINNSGNTFNGNNIFNYFGVAVSSAGVYIGGGNTDNNVTNNKFYQTATRTQTTGAQHSAVWISNTSGNNFQITGNTIGYSASNGTGTYSFVGVSSSSVFVPIFLSVGTTTASNASSNTVTGIAMSGAVSGTSSSGSFRGIYVSSGLTTCNSNTIGSQSATGAITFTSSSTSAADVMGIFNFGSSNWTTNNNTVGGITAGNSSTGAANIYGIRCNTSSSVTWTCTGNTIGGNIANSISSTSAATGTIVNGILNNNPIGTFTGNTVRNMSAAGGTGTGSTASLAGIVTTSSAVQIIGNNTIFNLSSALSGAANVSGITFVGTSTGANVVERNLVYDLNAASASASLFGINAIGSGSTTFRNNMVRLGVAGNSGSIGLAISGINETTGTNNFYHNSVYIGGAPTAGAGNSFAFQSSVTTNTRSYQNNIFVNSRSNNGATGKQYAIRVGGTAANPAGLTSNYNILFANGVGGFTGLFNAVDQATIGNWRTATGTDASSFYTDVPFLAATAATPNLHLDATISTVAEGLGIAIASVTDDFDGQTRSALTPNDIGADAFNGLGPAVVVINSVSITPTGNQCATVSRNVTANITAGSNNITSVTLNYAFNGVAQSPIAMTPGNLTAGETSAFTATIPASSPVNATVTWNVVAVDPIISKTTAGTTYQDEPLFGTTATAAVSVNPVCTGSATVLSGKVSSPGSSLVGTGTSTASNGSTDFNAGRNFYGSYWGNARQQWLIRASELTAAGLGAGNLSSLSLSVAAVGSPAALTNFTIKLAQTSATTITGAYNTASATQVYFNTSYPVVVGTNTHAFGTGAGSSATFAWDGTSNIIVDVCFANQITGSTSATNTYTVTGYASGVNYGTDGVAGAGACTTTTVSNSTTARPNITFTGMLAAPIATYSWSDGTSNVGTGNNLSVTPLVDTTYTVTMTTAGGCVATASTPLVTLLPLPSAPTAPATTSQCGPGIPTAVVTSTTGLPTPTFRWYNAGGTLLQSGTSATYLTSISSPTTFYVAEFNGTCESVRIPVAITIDTPQPLVVTPGATATVCDNGTLVMGATSSYAYETYSWTASPEAGSGIVNASPLLGQSVNVTPTAFGTYTYTVSATKVGGCNNVNTIVVTNSPKPAVTVTASDVSLCNNEISTLTASSPIPYAFATATGATLDPMVGATTVINSSNDDTPTAAPAAIGFNFIFNGVSYSQYSVSPDGWVLLGSTAAVADWTNGVTKTSNVPKLYPFWDDLSTGTNGSVQTLVTGVAPNRIFKVQWNVAVPRTSATGDAANSTFQAWLYETSGKIEYRYGTMGAQTSNSISAGYTINATTYNSITFSTNTSSSTTPNDANNSSPASGRLYSFTPSFNTFAWSPTTELYTDAAATAGNEYTGGNASVVYSKATAQRVYYVTATNALGCSSAVPASVTINQYGTVIGPITGGTTAACLAGANAQVPAVIDFNTALEGTVVYTSSNPSVATINANGVVTLLTTGTTVIGAQIVDPTPVTGCTSYATNTVTLNVFAPVVVTASPANQSILPGGTATFTAAATGSGLQYQWYYGTDGGFTFPDIVPGATSPTLIITDATLEMSGRTYRCQVSGTSPCSSFNYTTGALLTVSDLSITNPTQQIVCNSAGTANYSVEVSGPVETILWEVFTEGEWLLVEESLTIGAVTFGGDVYSDTLEVNGLTPANNNLLFRARAISGDTEVVSDPAGLIVNVPAVISVTPTPVYVKTVCYSGDTTSFHVEATGGTGYQWQFSTVGGANDADWTTIALGNASSLTTGVTYTNYNSATLNLTTTSSLAVAGPYYYRAVVFSPSPCDNVKSAQYELKVKTPNVEIVASSTIYCQTAPAITLQATGAATYSWNTTPVQTTASISVSPAANTTYIVTGTDATGCSKTAQVTIQAKKAIAVTAGPAETVCPNGSVQLTASTAEINPDLTIGSYTFEVATAPYATIVGGANTTALTLVPGTFVDDAISAAVTIPFTFVYGGNNFTSFKMNSNGWIQLGGATSSTANYSALSGSDNNIIAAFSKDIDSSVPYDASYFAQTSGAVGSRITKIEWSNIKGYDVNNPASGSAQIWLYEGSNIVELHYGAFTNSSESSSTAQVGLRGASSAAANVRSLSVTGSGSWSNPTVGNSSSSTAALGTVTTPVLPDSGTVYRFGPSSGNNTYTYAWTASPVDPSLANANTANPTANPSATTTYTVVATSNSGCVSASASTLVTVTTGATITTEPVGLIKCAGQAASFSVVATGPGLQYQWFKNGNPIASATSATLNIAATTVADSGNYHVVVTPTCGSADTSNVVVLTVNPLPTATITGTVSVCKNDPAPSVTLTGANGTAPYTFTYALNGVTQPTVTTVSGNSIALPVSMASAATYTYTLLSVQDVNCSQAQTGSAIVNVKELPTAIVATPASLTVCQDDIVTLAVTGGVFTGSGTKSASSGAISLAIPDVSATGVAQALAISGIPAGATITKVDVNFNISHNWDSDVEVNLEAPNGKVVNLVADRGDQGDNFTNTTVTSDATAASFTNLTTSAPFTGTFRADLKVQSSLIANYGTNFTTSFSDLFSVPNGTWTVRAYDDESIITGTLTSCSITIHYNFADQVNVTWSPNSQLYANSGATTVYNPAVHTDLRTIYSKPSNNKTYVATATALNGCSVVSNSVVLNVNPTPTAVAPANQVYYSGFVTAPIVLTGTPSGVVFDITGGAAAGLADQPGVTTIPSFTATGATAIVTITPRANGCTGLPVTYQIAPIPVVVNISSNVCGSVNNGLNNQINCTQVSIPGYTTTGYMFEVTNTATGEVAVVFSSQHHFKLTDSNNYAYGTTFTIRVAAVLNGQVQGYFGNTCSLTTASVATSRVVTAQCGSTLVFLNSTINANSVSSTNLYRFRVALASAPTVTYLVERSAPNFRLTDVVGLPLLYNTEYLVDVQIRVKLAGFEAWSQYGVRCSIFTPTAPETSLVASQCEDYAVPSSTSPINAIAFPGATAYRFRLTGYDEFGDVNYQQTVTNVGPSFTLSQFSGLTAGNTYTVAVAMELFGTFTDYAKDCSVIVPITGKHVVAEPFKATAYPNPFAANFMIDVKTTSDSVITIKVYDMVGRLVEQKTATVAQLETSPIGNNYPSGVYNVVVTQDETVQTVRVVKR